MFWEIRMVVRSYILLCSCFLFVTRYENSIRSNFVVVQGWVQQLPIPKTNTRLYRVHDGLVHRRKVKLSTFSALRSTTINTPFKLVNITSSFSKDETFVVPSEKPTGGTKLLIDSTTIVPNLDETERDDDDDDDSLEGTPRSMFGTKIYWDDVYLGRGDFPSDEYTWYYGWDVIQKISKEYNIPLFGPIPSASSTSQQQQQPKYRHKILIPGIGNDRLLIDMIQSSQYNPQSTTIVAQDYSSHAIERQRDLLEYYYDSNYSNNDNSTIQLVVNNARRLPTSWHGTFDIIVEKGLLDAVYLSSVDDDDVPVQEAVSNLYQCLKPNGILLSISGVVPNELRQTKLFPIAARTDVTTSTNTVHHHPPIMTWKWIRDGTQDLQAGCFILQKSTCSVPHANT